MSGIPLNCIALSQEWVLIHSVKTFHENPRRYTEKGADGTDVEPSLNVPPQTCRELLAFQITRTGATPPPGVLKLIEARGHQKHLTVIGIEPNVHLARLERFVDPDHALGNLIVGTFFPVRPVKLVPVPVLIRPTDK